MVWMASKSEILEIHSQFLVCRPYARNRVCSFREAPYWDAAICEISCHLLDVVE